MTKGDLLLKQFLRLANTNDMLLEIYYKRTPYGREIFRQHRTRHRYWELRDQSFFSTLDEETMDVVLRFMNLYNGYLDLKLANQMDPNHEASFAEEAEGGETDEHTV